MNNTVSISLLSGTDTIVVRKQKNSNVFIITADALIVNKYTLLAIINYMVKNDIISVKALEGIIEEYNTE